MASSINNSAWLDWMAGLMAGASRQTLTSTFPPDSYYCLLDELPVHLIPRAALARKVEGGRDLFLNPRCELHAAGTLPSELESQKELLSGFALQCTIAWLRDGNSGLLPFWLGPKLESLVRELRSGEPIPPSFPLAARSILERAGILVSESSIARSESDRKNIDLRAFELFQSKGYAPLHDLIHPFHIAALRRYYRHRIRTGTIHLGDDQSSRRYAVHNDPVTKFFHRQIASRVSEVVGETVKPSYVYLACYLSGAELKKHVDREQCQFSITFCLDFSPEPALATPWPICLDSPTGKVTVYQALGDGLAYRGTRLPHYRSKLGSGQTSTSIFFHYVAADFAGSLD